MNNLDKKISSLFSSNSTLIEAGETYEEVKIIIEIDSANCPPFSNLFELVNSRDKFHLTFKSKNDGLITYVQNGKKTYEDFCLEVPDLKEPLELEFGISKKQIDSVISIYSLDLFTNYLLKGQSLTGILYIFTTLFNPNNRILFELQNDDTILKTNSISFLPKGILNDSSCIENTRKIRNDQVKNVCHWNIHSPFIPEDFHIVDFKTDFSNLVVLFNRLEQLYSLIYLADITHINEKIGYKIVGYKSITNEVSFNEMDYSCLTFFKIYNWVYNDGNLIDKIGLARNIISLHLDNETNSIPESTFNSIQSSFKIYQKENIKQYIELRNKISDQLFEFKNKADKIIETYANDFKRSLFAFISFFASILVLRVVSNNNLSGTFTRETTLLSFAFLFITFLIFLASKWELKKQKERYEESYKNLKERHKDLLNDDDIELILNKDKDFQDNIDFINEKRKIYSKIWIFSLILLAIIILVLYDANNNWSTFNFLKDVIFRIFEVKSACCS